MGHNNSTSGPWVAGEKGEIEGHCAKSTAATARAERDPWRRGGLRQRSGGRAR